jgi:hypothetical protein
MENWKDAPGFPGYQVSDIGRVKRVARLGKKGLIPERILHPVLYLNGYLVVNLSGQRIGVHRLVALAFIPNPNMLPQINHRNEIKADNRSCNLEWCDSLYNNNYGTRTLKASISRSIPIKQLTKDGVLVREYYGIHEAGRQTNIDYRNIHLVLTGKRKTAGGFKWIYKNN